MNRSVLSLSKLFLLIIFIFLFVAIFQLAFPQSIESVKEKIKNNDLEGAQTEVIKILQKDKNNIDALELLNKIKKLKRQKESEILTKKALIAIDNEDFEVAYDLLEKALVLDPDNKKARDLFLSLNDVVNIEKKSEKEEQKIESEKIAKKEEMQIAKAQESKVKNVPEKKEEIVIKEEKNINQTISKEEKKKPKKQEFTNWLEAEVFPLFAFTKSNRLNYIDSSQSLVGSGLGVSYYPNFIKRKVGISIDYLSFFIKTSGSDYIKFNIHRFNISLKYRFYLLKDSKGNKLFIEPKLGYSYFYLNNLMNYGAYDFKKLYGPSIGVRLLDPVFYRFINKDFLKKIGMKAVFNLLYIPQKNAPISPEFYIGSYYKIKKSFNVNLGFRSYMIFKGDVHETYNDIEAGVSYFM